MACKVGDKVRFLDDVGGGAVLRIEGSTVFVADEDGFEMPTHISNVVVVEGVRENNFPAQLAEKKPEPARPGEAAASPPAPAQPQQPAAEAAQPNSNGNNSEPEHDQQGSSYELMLAFLPPKNDKSELYLLNDSPYRVHYCAGMYERSGGVMPLAQGSIMPDSKQLLKAVSLSELREARILRLQVLLHKNIPYAPYDLAPADVELNPLKFFRQGAFTENEFFDENALIYRVFSSEGAEKEKMSSVSAEEVKLALLQKNEAQPKPQSPQPEPEVEEVDLHAEMLVSDPGKLQAGELLELQLARFTAVLENALKSGRKGRLVFIHGIGSGKLKQELRSSLAKNYSRLSFQDASFKEYGYGATMVFL